MKIQLEGFKDIKLSLKALRQTILNQIIHSKESIFFASDIQESKDFVSNLESVLINMDNLFGNLLDNTPFLCVIESE